jgi:2',3'-cyclic-nucleotide 2'-phosphodiesterase (5'-nucleotidase family)
MRIQSRRSRTLTALAALTVAGLVGAGAAQPAGAGQQGAGRTVDVQLLAINDFHGNLEPPAGSGGQVKVGVNPDGTDRTVEAGGVEYLATHLDRLRAQHRNSLTVAAGDLVGASPLLSAAFHDEPTIEALNLVGLDVSAVGNHEFDEGYRELLRLQHGGCIDDGAGRDNQDSCPDGTFDGADFTYLSANVTYTKTGQTVLPAVSVQEVDGVRVGFIGMTLEGTPAIVTRAGIQGLTFSDEVATANRYAWMLRRQGVESIVVLVHEGGVPPTGSAYDFPCSTSDGTALAGPIVPIAQNLTPEVDLIVSGHTHQSYVCDIPDRLGRGRMVTSGSSFGRLVTDIRLQIDRPTKEVVRTRVAADNRIVTRDVPKDDRLTELMTKYGTYLGPLAAKVIGYVSEPITRSTDPDGSGDSALGNLVADAQKADPSIAGAGPVDVAFMNPGGIRNDLVPSDAGEVTYKAAFDAQPFNNYLVSMDLTGAQIDALLEQQFDNPEPGTNRILQVSAGFSYSWDPAAPVGSRVDIADITLDGTPIDPAATYRVAVNSFLADGGDGFTVLTEAANKLYGGLDIDALADYLSATTSPADPYTPLPLDRISLGTG